MGATVRVEFVRALTGLFRVSINTRMPSWRMNRPQLQKLYDSYRKNYDADCKNLRNMTPRDKALLGQLAVQRLESMDRAAAVNGDFMTWLLEGVRKAEECPEKLESGLPVMQVLVYPGVPVGKGESYGSFASVCYHF